MLLVAPKRKRPSGDEEEEHEVRKSRMIPESIVMLKDKRMVISTRAPSSKVIPKLEDNEVVIFRDLPFAGLHFKLDPVIVDIICLLDIYLHQLTPNALVHMLIYIWICWTTKIKASAEGFAAAHKVHHQPKYLLEDEDGVVVEKEDQFGCLNFVYHTGVLSPIATHRNKWPNDWH